MYMMSLLIPFPGAGASDDEQLSSVTVLMYCFIGQLSDLSENFCMINETMCLNIGLKLE